MDIKEYYNSKFKLEIERLMADLNLPCFGHCWHFDCPGLEKIDSKERSLFLICLYFTALSDQVVYTYFREHYEKFKLMTRFPEFCNGLGRSEKYSSRILTAPVEKGLVDKLELNDSLGNGIRFFVDELFDFLITKMPEINPRDFFNQLLEDPYVQMPLVMALAKSDGNIDEGTKAFSEIRMAIEGRIKSLPQAAVKAVPPPAEEKPIEKIPPRRFSNPAEENLRSIAECGMLSEFVRENRGQWNHQKWLELCDKIKEKGYFPVDFPQVGLMLEKEKASYFAAGGS